MSRWIAATLLCALMLPAVALAHTERPSYWPDPAPDTSVSPPAGGEIPKARSLRSAVTGAGPGEVRVVCQRSSLRRAIKSIRQIRRKGFRLRPSQPKARISKKRAKRLIKWNRKFSKRCEFGSIQAAVDASGNNDRIVIMPGTYTEPESRSAPVNDPKCNPSMLQQDASGDNTPSYAYQVNCPNDQNLVYVQGRAVKGEPLGTPRDDRQGIPEQELGECVKCNLQMEGSTPRPTDTIIDAGEDYEGKGPEARPGGHAKHVALRVDRGDGFVGKNMLMRGALEFGFYAEETDGVLLDRTHFFWNADYGHLSFTTDHHMVRNCDGMGAGDAALYPGAAPETGSQATAFYPDAPRPSTVITKCDMRNSALGYSGSMGNAVRVTNNHIYGNTAGLASDTLSSAGHPGFPTDSVELDNNFFYSNNFEVYDPKSPVEPLVGVPSGTGVVFAGINDANVHDNWFFDNYRDGVMLFAVPDFLTSYGGPEGTVYPGVSCPGAPENGISTSCGNRFHNNKMGQVPMGFRFPKKLERYGIAHAEDGAETAPNGNDFWWDEFATNTANCWFGNQGPDGQESSVTGAGDAGRMPGAPPNPLPNCSGGADPGSSVGTGDPAKELYLLDCGNGPDTASGPLDCDWWDVPPKPGSAAAAARSAEFAKAAREFATTEEAKRLQARMEELAAGADR